MIGLICLIIVNSIFQCSGKIISLNSSDWNLKDDSGQYVIDGATVPGGLYTELVDHGIIGDPNYGYDDYNQRVWSKKLWTWTRNFDGNDDLKSSNEIYLVAHGIDTVSKVYINDQVVGDTNNMFRRYRFKVNDKLKAGSNSIKIEVYNPYAYAQEQYNKFKGQYGYDMVPQCFPDGSDYGECHASFIRKMMWGWGPAFRTSGIYLPVEIEIIESTNKLENFWTTITSLDENKWSVDLSLALSRPESGKQVNVEVTLSTNDPNYEKELTIYSGSINTDSSTDTYRISSIPVEKSRVGKWWPNGATYVQNNQIVARPRTLYNVKVTLKPSDGSKQQSMVKRTGFREIKLIQEIPKVDGKDYPGLSFRFEVNGEPFYIKGSNFYPTSVHTENENRDKDYVKKTLQAAVDSQQNMLRIWGGGIYQTDYFYDLADEMGLLIWQDFMFVCATYPTDPEFLDNVKVEVEQQVTRLAHHPSIAIWSGSNENELAIGTHWWWPRLEDKYSTYVEDFKKLYTETIKTIVFKYDTTRPYVVSSPSNGAFTEQNGGFSSNADDHFYGDIHFYYHEADAWEQKNYPAARFISEFGFESLPSYESYATSVPESELVYPFSGWLEHRASGDRLKEIETMVDYYMGKPTETGKNGYLKMTYLSQILQAVANKREMEFFLRNREINTADGSGFTWGAMYWIFNDIWVASGWSTIEFGTAKWKMAQYFLRDSYKPVFGQLYTENDQLKAVINNDVSGKVNVAVTINVHQLDSFNKQTIADQTNDVDSFKATVVYDKKLSEAVSSDLKNCVVELKYNTVQSSVADFNSGENFLLLAKPKELNLKQSNIKINDVSKDDSDAGKKSLSSYSNIYKINLSTDYPALFVWLDFKVGSGIDGVFSTNGFNMLDSSKEVFFGTNKQISVDDIKNLLTVTHLKENIN
uniref:beta-mannosidase n=1 Tax=Tetranychus urticae TaxID=32264 RepID=T1KP49_TETUR